MSGDFFIKSNELIKETNFCLCSSFSIRTISLSYSPSVTSTSKLGELEKLIYNRLEFLEDGKVAIAYINLEDYENSHAEMGDDEGLVEMIRDIEDVEVAVLLKEKEGANGYKASLRSHEVINVSDICMLLGGGGHRGAAGCFVSGTLEQAKSKIINAVKQGLKK